MKRVPVAQTENPFFMSGPLMYKLAGWVISKVSGESRSHKEKMEA